MFIDMSIRAMVIPIFVYVIIVIMIIIHYKQVNEITQCSPGTCLRSELKILSKNILMDIKLKYLVSRNQCPNLLKSCQLIV